MSIGRTERTRLLGAPAILGNWLSRSQIKSIQTGTVTIANASASGTANVTAVVVANSILTVTGWSCATTTAASSTASAVITNTTTITASRVGTASELILSFSLIEYLPGYVRSNQDFSITIAAAAASNTATITAVTTTRAEIYSRGATYDTAGANHAATAARLVLTNATTVTATRADTTGELIIKGTVAEL